MEHSLKVTEESGTLMKDIIPEVQKTAKLVQEIAAASMEQNSGADQVNAAIQQLNQVTQQNAAASEEMATGAEELAGQAEQLNEIISFFYFDKKDKRNIKSAVKSEKPKTSPPAQKQTTHKGVHIVLNKNTDDYERF